MRFTNFIESFTPVPQSASLDEKYKYLIKNIPGDTTERAIFADWLFDQGYISDNLLKGLTSSFIGKYHKINLAGTLPSTIHIHLADPFLRKAFNQIKGNYPHLEMILFEDRVFEKEDESVSSNYIYFKADYNFNVKCKVYFMWDGTRNWFHFWVSSDRPGINILTSAYVVHMNALGVDEFLKELPECIDKQKMFDYIVYNNMINRID